MNVNSTPPPRPFFKINIHQATRFSNRLAVVLRVENIGTAAAKELDISDYLIISNPIDVMDTMGRLAIERNVVVGLVTTNNPTIVDALITPPGNNALYEFLVNDNWAKQMHPNFSKALGGYVLLVGEIEIVPSWLGTGFANGAKAPESDHLYSDTGGDGRPELIVGQVIGDKAACRQLLPSRCVSAS